MNTAPVTVKSQINSAEAKQKVRAIFSALELQYFEEMVGFYETTRLGINRVKEKTLVREMPILWDFVAFCEAPPWRIASEDIPRWGAYSGEFDQ